MSAAENLVLAVISLQFVMCLSKLIIVTVINIINLYFVSSKGCQNANILY